MGQQPGKSIGLKDLERKVKEAHSLDLTFMRYLNLNNLYHDMKPVNQTIYVREHDQSYQLHQGESPWLGVLLRVDLHNVGVNMLTYRREDIFLVPVGEKTLIGRMNASGELEYTDGLYVRPPLDRLPRSLTVYRSLNPLRKPPSPTMSAGHIRWVSPLACKRQGLTTCV